MSNRRRFLKTIAAAPFCGAVSQATTLVRYPYLQNVRGERATMIWTTLEDGSGEVRYSTDQSYSRSVTARTQRFGTTVTGLNAPYYQYQAELTGLSAGTDYFYRVMLDGQDVTPGVEQRFRTAGPGPFTFLVFGDSGEGSPEQRQLARLMMQERFALVLHTGDLAYPSGTFELLQKNYFDIYFDLMKRVPFFPSPGVHEYFADNAAAYVAVHALPSENVSARERGRYYSFDWGNVHFISLDTNAPLADAANGTGSMLEWLENDLRNTRQFWRIAYFHHAPYASGVHERDPVHVLVRDRIVPILERYGVQLAFNGHEHSYQQSQPIRNGSVVEAKSGTVYVTTGGGGAGLYPVFPLPMLVYQESAYHYVRGEVQGHRITLRAIRVDAQEIDNITFASPPVLASGGTVNAASFTPSLAPGALISIFGGQLGAEETQAPSLPLPSELSGASVTLNGRRLPLLFVSPAQINAQLPFDVQGQATLRVTTPNGSAEASVMILETAPAIFSILTGLGRLPAVVHPNGTLVSAASPAEPGEFLSVYVTGLGRVNGEISAGQPAPISPLLATRAPVEAQLSGIPVSPSFAGLAPGFVGLYQVNLQVPRELTTGTYALRLIAGGVPSNVVSVPVRSRGSGDGSGQ